MCFLWLLLDLTRHLRSEQVVYRFRGRALGCVAARATPCRAVDDVAALKTASGSAFSRAVQPFNRKKSIVKHLKIDFNLSFYAPLSDANTFKINIKCHEAVCEQ